MNEKNYTIEKEQVRNRIIKVYKQNNQFSSKVGL